MAIKSRKPVTIEITGFFVARRKGFDLRCGAGQVAALTCSQHVIHYRSRSNPDYKNNPDTIRYLDYWHAVRDSNP